MLRKYFASKHPNPKLNGIYGGKGGGGTGKGPKLHVSSYLLRESNII